MAEWYEKYLSIYDMSFSEVPQEVIDGTRERECRACCLYCHRRL